MKILFTGSNGMVGTAVPRHSTVRKILLICGMLSSLLYVAFNILGAMQWEHYSFASQSVSELSSIGAPSRPLVVPIGIVYQILVTAFGVGVWMSAGRSRPLRIAAVMLIVFGLVGLSAPFFPMQPPGTDPGLTGTVHKIMTAVTVLFMFFAIGFGGAALGKRFRVYSIITILLLLVFGAVGAMQAPRVEAGLPTPLLGVVERINIGVFLLWVVVLAVALLRGPADSVRPENK